MHATSIRAVLTLVACATLLGITGCRSVLRLDLPLLYEPSTRVDVPVGEGFGNQIYHVAVVDRRPVDHPDRLGVVSVEAPARIIYVTGPITATGLVERGFVEEFSQRYARFIDDPARAEAIIRFDLHRMFIDVPDTMHADIRVQVSVMRDGQVRFSDAFIARTDRMRPVSDPASYQEMLSNALVDLYRQLLNDEAFVEAMYG